MDTEIALETVTALPLSQIDTDYERYRLIVPAADETMRKSLEQYGQLIPVVVGRPIEGRYLLVDGFKRLRALRKMGRPSVTAGIMNVGPRALKAAMIQLNRNARNIAELEEAMIVCGLHREDGLSQVEIGEMVGQHKSWVCRRIAMVERLDEEVLEQIRLGLVSYSIGRELTRLPRGNQGKALDAILDHRMNSRESARLVSLLQENPRGAHDAILRSPDDILLDRGPDRPTKKEPSSPSRTLFRDLFRIGKLCETLETRFKKEDPSLLNQIDRRHVLTQIDNIEGHLRVIRALPHLSEKSNEPLF